MKNNIESIDETYLGRADKSIEVVKVWNKKKERLFYVLNDQGDFKVWDGLGCFLEAIMSQDMDNYAFETEGDEDLDKWLEDPRRLQ